MNSQQFPPHTTPSQPHTPTTTTASHLPPPSTPMSAQPQFQRQQLPQQLQFSQQQSPQQPQQQHQSGPAPGAPAGSMGPPSRPPEKTTDAADLADILVSSGIDVKAEEAYLTTTSGAPRSGPQMSGGGPAAASPAISTPNTPTTAGGNGPGFQQRTPSMAMHNSSDIYPSPSTTNPMQQQQQQRFPAKPSPSFPATQPIQSSLPTTPQSGSVPTHPQTQAQAQHQLSERQRRDNHAARREQYPMHSTYLQLGCVESRTKRRAQEQGLKVPTQGVYHPYPGRHSVPVEVAGPDGSTILQTGQTLVSNDSPFVDILSLISLACEERVRSVVEQAATLARNRQANSHGLVPETWKGVAVDDGEDNQAKNNIALKSRKLIERDLSLEEQRAAKRAKRTAEATPSTPSADANADGSTKSPAGSRPSTPGPGDRAPDVPEKKVTKKDIKRAESRVSAAAQHRQAIETARMATGNLTSSGSGLFGKKKTYSWLTGGKPTTPTKGAGRAMAGGGGGGSGGTGGGGPRSPLTGSGSPGGNNGGGSTPGSATKPGSQPAPGIDSVKRNIRQFGMWREDDPVYGGGIQTRDVMLVLELDGRSSRNLQRGYTRDPKEEYDQLGAKDKAR